MKKSDIVKAVEILDSYSKQLQNFEIPTITQNQKKSVDSVFCSDIHFAEKYKKSEFKKLASSIQKIVSGLNEPTEKNRHITRENEVFLRDFGIDVAKLKSEAEIQKEKLKVLYKPFYFRWYNLGYRFKNLYFPFMYE